MMAIFGLKLFILWMTTAAALGDLTDSIKPCPLYSPYYCACSKDHVPQVRPTKMCLYANSDDYDCQPCPIFLQDLMNCTECPEETCTLCFKEKFGPEDFNENGDFYPKGNMDIALKDYKMEEDKASMQDSVNTNAEVLFNFVSLNHPENLEEAEAYKNRERDSENEDGTEELDSDEMTTAELTELMESCPTYAQYHCACSKDHVPKVRPTKMCLYADFPDLFCKPCPNFLQDLMNCTECPEETCTLCFKQKFGPEDFNEKGEVHSLGNMDIDLKFHKMEKDEASWQDSVNKNAVFLFSPITLNSPENLEENQANKNRERGSENDRKSEELDNDGKKIDTSTVEEDLSKLVSLNSLEKLKLKREGIWPISRNFTKRWDAPNQWYLPTRRNALNNWNLPNRWDLPNKWNLPKRRDALNHWNLSNRQDLPNEWNLLNRRDLPNEWNIPTRRVALNHWNLPNRRGLPNELNLLKRRAALNHWNFPNRWDPLKEWNLLNRRVPPNEWHIPNKRDVPNDRNISNGRDVPQEWNLLNEHESLSEWNLPIRRDAPTEWKFPNEWNVPNEGDYPDERMFPHGRHKRDWGIEKLNTRVPKIKSRRAKQGKINPFSKRFKNRHNTSAKRNISWKPKSSHDFNVPEDNQHLLSISSMNISNGGYHEALNISKLVFSAQNQAKESFTVFHLVSTDFVDNVFSPKNSDNPLYHAVVIGNKSKLTFSNDYVNNKTSLEYEAKYKNFGSDRFSESVTRDSDETLQNSESVTRDPDVTFQKNIESECTINGIYSVYDLENSSRSSVLVFQCLVLSQKLEMNQLNVSSAERSGLGEPNSSILPATKIRNCYFDAITNTSSYIARNHLKTVPECREISPSAAFFELIQKSLDNEIQESNLSHKKIENSTSFNIVEFGLRITISHLHLTKPNSMQEIRVSHADNKETSDNVNNAMKATFPLPEISTVSRLLLLHDNSESNNPLVNNPSIEYKSKFRRVLEEPLDLIISMNVSTMFGLPDLNSIESLQEQLSLPIQDLQNEKNGSFFAQVGKLFIASWEKFKQLSELPNETDVDDFLNGNLSYNAFSWESHKINVSGLEHKQLNKSNYHCPTCNLVYKLLLRSGFNKSGGSNRNNAYVVEIEKPEVIINKISNHLDNKTLSEKRNRTQDVFNNLLSADVNINALLVPLATYQSLQSENSSVLDIAENIFYNEPLTFNAELPLDEQVTFENIIKEFPDLAQDIDYLLFSIVQETHKLKSDGKLNKSDKNIPTANELLVSNTRDLVQMRYMSLPDSKANDDDGDQVKNKQSGEDSVNNEQLPEGSVNKEQLPRDNAKIDENKTNVEGLEHGPIYGRRNDSGNELGILTNTSRYNASSIFYRSDDHVEIPELSLFNTSKENSFSKEYVNDKGSATELSVVSYRNPEATANKTFLPRTDNVSNLNQLRSFVEDPIRRTNNTFEEQNAFLELNLTTSPEENFLVTGFLKHFERDGNDTDKSRYFLGTDILFRKALEFLTGQYGNANLTERNNLPEDSDFSEYRDHYVEELPYKKEVLEIENDTQTVNSNATRNFKKFSVAQKVKYGGYSTEINGFSGSPIQDNSSSYDEKFLEDIFEDEAETWSEDQPMEEKSLLFHGGTENNETAVAFNIRESEVMSRSKRRALPQNNWCKVPSMRKNGHLGCTVWTHKKECTLTCLPGYTFDKQKSVKLRCQRKENCWVPKFKACEGSPAPKPSRPSPPRPAQPPKPVPLPCVKPAVECESPRPVQPPKPVPPRTFPCVKPAVDCESPRPVQPPKPEPPRTFPCVKPAVDCESLRPVPPRPEPPRPAPDPCVKSGVDCERVIYSDDEDYYEPEPDQYNY